MYNIHCTSYCRCKHDNYKAQQIMQCEQQTMAGIRQQTVTDIPQMYVQQTIAGVLPSVSSAQSRVTVRQSSGIKL